LLADELQHLAGERIVVEADRRASRLHRPPKRWLSMSNQRTFVAGLLLSLVWAAGPATGAVGGTVALSDEGVDPA